MNPFVSIVILTFNRKKILRKLLSSVSEIQYTEHEVIVIDNNSSDGTGEMVVEEFPNITYCLMKKNLGVAARNEGLKLAKGEIIVTIDDDIFGINDDAIMKLIHYFQTNVKVGALNFKVIDNVEGAICNWIHHREEEKFHEKDFLTYEITEGAVAFSKKALETAGYYPEYFFLSHEGPDLALRIMNVGFEVRYSPLISVIHSHAQEGRKSWFRYYYDTRNQFLLAMRNYPFFYSVRYLVRGFLSTLFYSIRDGFFLYWIKGVFDGIIGSYRHYKDRNPLSKDTMSAVYRIDSERPSFIYMLKKRVFCKEMRL